MRQLVPDQCFQRNENTGPEVSGVMVAFVE